ncbi:MAG: hypothetical protein J0L64_13335 [Acidobacteria bacterium]|nr:hypothetical protein [Acidobacteriota bacterium]
MRALLLLLIACALPAQESPTDTFLQLDRTQRQTINRNNADHERWRRQKEDRVNQVRGEIFDETNRSPLDPTALGLRHAEVESICREIDERELQLVKVNRDILTDAQKLKLAALEEVMRLAPTANSAINDNLIHAAPLPLSPLAGNAFAGFLLGVGPYSPWPAKQRTGVCAANRSTTLGFAFPPLTPAP